MRKIYFSRAALLLAVGLVASFSAGCGSDTKADTKNKTSADAASGDATNGGDGITGVDATQGGDATSADATSGDGVGGDSSAGDTEVKAKYPTCSAIGDCVAKACAKGEKDCEKPCLASADEQALMEAVPLLSCYQSKCVQGACKDSKDPQKCNNDCLTENCISDFMKCIDTPAVGDKVCSAAFGCFDKCDITAGSGFACYTACIDALTPEDTKLILAVGTCMANNSGKDVDKACPKELGACMVGSKAGDQACYTTFKCSADCQKAGGSEDNCTPECLGKLTKEGQQQFMALIPCLGGAKMDTDPKCQTALKTCIAPTGKDNCADVFDCVKACPKAANGEDDPSCMFACLHDTDTDAYDTFMELAACNQDKATTTPGGVTPTDAPGGVTPTDKPTSKACLQSMVTCAEPSGTGDCAALFGCVVKCQNTGKGSKEDKDLTCIFDCAPSADKQAFTDLVTFANCSDTCKASCAGKDGACKNTCMAKACPTELKACFPAG